MNTIFIIAVIINGFLASILALIFLLTLGKENRPEWDNKRWWILVGFMFFAFNILVISSYWWI